MKAGIGKLTALLADSDESIPSAIVGLINERIDPPQSLTVDDVYVRAMYIVSDSVNSFGGRFPVDEHEKLARMLIDSPVLVGHRKDQLPVARTFHAETTEREGRPWVKSYFYWPKSADGALKLKERIDGGIVKECSISFTFTLPECSVCGKDIRLCPHEALQKVGSGSEGTVCHFNYREIERVLETSLVYRGAIPGTGITKPTEVLKDNSESAPAVADSRKKLESFTQLDSDKSYLVVPNYEGISLTIGGDEQQAKLTRTDGTAIPVDLAERFDLSVAGEYSAYQTRLARLVGYQGKRRCSVQSLERFLTSQSSSVTRVVLFLYPDENHPFAQLKQIPGSHEVRILPHRHAGPNALDAVGAEIMTRLGVEIRSLPLDADESECFVYQPQLSASPAKPGEIVTIDTVSSTASVSLSAHKSKPRVVIHAFDHKLLEKERAFVADLYLPPDKEGLNKTHQYDTVKLVKLPCGYRLEIRDKRQPLCGSFRLRPIKLNGATRQMFTRLVS